MEKNAEQAWGEKVDIIAATLPCQNSNCGFYTRKSAVIINQLLSDYKQALRQAIDNELYNCQNNAKISAFNRVVELLDTVKPL